jgi:two-component system, NtrC family, response regulator HydG
VFMVMERDGIFSAWLAATDDGAIAVNASGDVVLHNHAASRVTGLAPDEALGKTWRDVVHVDDTLAASVWSTRTTTTAAHLTTDILCAQGNRRSVEMVASAWSDQQGATGVLIVIRDLAVLCRQWRTPAGRAGYGNLIGAHPRMQELYHLIDVVGPSEAPVVIEGETGVGKELVAQLLHARSARAEHPLIAVHAAALAPGVLESELFGHVRGAFTGAAGTVLGRFERADTGTLFLDEVSEIPLATQVKLLRALQTGEIERLGESRTRRVDVRVLAASNRPLQREVDAGRFRTDLYYRLKVVRIEVPALRDRASDIPMLVEHFIARYAGQPVEVTPAAMALLTRASWPGNVRELENAVRHALTMRPQGPLAPDDFPAELHMPSTSVPGLVEREPSPGERRALLTRALALHRGSRSAAARSLGIGRATFYRWWHDAGLGPLPRRDVARHDTSGETAETLD